MILSAISLYITAILQKGFLNAYIVLLHIVHIKTFSISSGHII